MVGDELRRLKGPIFITGHTGFKGSWLSLLLNHLGIEHFGYSLEAEMGSLYRRAKLENMSQGVIGDIKNLKKLSSVIKEIRPSVIIHLAAQPLVLKSYREPLDTFETNCMGTANVLRAAFETDSVEIVLIITTDKVYRNDNSGRRFVESDPLEGKDPYSASKVAAEAACVAWRQISKISGGPKVLVARAGNVIGGGDFASNRIIPDIIRSILYESDLVVRSPKSTRPWQHVLDPLIGYLKYIEFANTSTEIQPSLNFGPIEPSLRIESILEIARDFFGNELKVNFEEINQEIESNVLELDPSLAFATLSWRPMWNQREAIKRTFLWWRNVLADPSSSLLSCTEDIKLYLGES